MKKIYFKKAILAMSMLFCQTMKVFFITIVNGEECFIWNKLWWS